MRVFRWSFLAPMLILRKVQHYWPCALTALLSVVFLFASAKDVIGSSLVRKFLYVAQGICSRILSRIRVCLHTSLNRMSDATPITGSGSIGAGNSDSRSRGCKDV